MIRIINVNGTEIVFDLQYKKVKNINMRIKGDGTVHVSASRRVPWTVIEEFVRGKVNFIENARANFQKKAKNPKVQYCTEEEIKEKISAFCRKVYPYYEKYGVSPPQIRFRNMVSRWGSCHRGRGILTFNVQLMYAPPACTEYVVLHEFTHFLEPNHGAGFYKELEKVCPDWKACRNKLAEICLR